MEVQQGKPTQPLSSNPDPDISHFDIEYWDELGAYRMLETKGIADGEKETCVSGENEIPFDKEADENTHRGLHKENLYQDRSHPTTR